MIFGLVLHLRSREGLAVCQNRAWLVMKSASSKTPQDYSAGRGIPLRGKPRPSTHQARMRRIRER